jgi:hypothetical protein
VIGPSRQNLSDIHIADPIYTGGEKESDILVAGPAAVVDSQQTTPTSRQRATTILLLRLAKV